MRLSRCHHAINVLKSIVRSTVLASLLLAAASAAFGQTIQIENLDGVPFPDRLVFNRIGSLENPPSNGVHERAVLRISNAGGADLEITGLTISGRNDAKFALENPPALPAVVAPGSSLDLTVRYVAESLHSVHSASLTIASNDTAMPTTVVELAGFWQSVSENNQEPSLSQIIAVLGYDTVIAGEDDTLNRGGRIAAAGDEVLSAYWRRADTSRPVTLRQLAAFHTYPRSDPIYWHYQGEGSPMLIVRHHSADAQSMLPRQRGSELPAEGQFSPSTTISGGVFGFRVGTSNEWSDPALNDKSVDDCSDGLETCGHHVRFWTARDRQGAVIPNTFILSMDYSGINYDYNDNVYLISNITPATAGAFVERDGQVVVESESYAAEIARSGKQWIPFGLTGSVGTSLQADPVTGTVIDTGYARTSPELQYPVQFTWEGTYYVWMRARGASEASDSWHMGLNGQELAPSDRMEIGGGFDTWEWSDGTIDSERAFLQIPSPGTYMVNVWMREDGVHLDRFILTSDPNFTPVGSGPEASIQTYDLVANTPTASEDPDGGATPNRFELRQNYPNPFNPTTTIEYALREPVHVTLEVLDALGRRVATLVDEVQAAGEHRSVFQAEGLSTGVYIYRLRAGSFTSSARMVLLQ